MTKSENSIDSIKTDCRWFVGHIPCKPHKQQGVHCTDEQGNACPHYEPQITNILVIKLGALGDVIRTTPLLHRFKKEFPHARIWWLTLSPDIVPRSMVDVVLPFTPEGVVVLQQTHFTFAVNLDKDKEACALMNSISSDVKKGYMLKNGKPAPIDNDAVHKFMTGVFDDLNKANTKSYLEEIFEICGMKFAGEKYILDSHADKGYVWKLPKKKKIVGLNSGCGGRWSSRLWAEKNWVALAKKLKKAGYVPLLLGGEQEHEKNKRIAKKSGALYLGHFPLQQFINLIAQCDLVVTAVTMAMHMIIGLDKKIVLFNNIFNRHEFELYGLGEILEPEFDCPCYFSPVCPNDCMQYIYVDRVFKTVKKLLTERQ
ncbi:MAG: glycosyltransferase family 9 protein [Bacteroidota bacterium]